MENEGFKLSRFRRDSQLSQLAGLVVDFLDYVNHLYFLKFSPKFFKLMVALQELGFLDLNHLVYLFSDDFGVTLVSDSLSADLFG